MNSKIVFIATFLCFLQNTFGQSIGLGRGNNFPGNNIGFGNGNGNNGIGIGNNVGFGNNPVHNMGTNVAPSVNPIISDAGSSSISFNGLPISNLSPVGTGDVSVIGDLPIVGTTAVIGNVPVIGYVTFEGNVPAGGTVSVTGTCECNNPFA